MEHLTDDVFASLSQIIKPCTWVVRVTYELKKKPLQSHGTAFAIKLGDPTSMDTVLMTCGHVVNKPNCCIEVRKVDDQDFILKAETLAIKLSWDIALLVVKGVTNNPYVEFADDGSIANCQTLLHVGHAFDFVWSTFIGRAAYPCVDYIYPFNAGDTCKEYDCSSLFTTPAYRVMGHVCNKGFFEEHESEFPYQKNLNPHIPIIQCSGFCCNEGCSGGPVINSQGRIVGMLHGDVSGNEIAIHVTLLKQFVRLNSNATPHSVEASSSQPSKKLKMKGLFR